MARKLKQIVVEELTRQYGQMDRCVVVNFTGIPHETDVQIRKTLRDHQITLKVVKSSLMALALRDIGLQKLVGLLEGPCALATGGRDVVELAKVLSAVAEKNGKFVIRGGYGEGQVLATRDVKRFATIPPRPTLIASFLGAAQGTIRRAVGTLGVFTRSFVSVLDAVAKKKAGGTEEAGTPSELSPNPNELTAARAPTDEKDIETASQ